MASTDRLESQVRALRALAHPIRLRLLRLAAVDGEVTSTSASERTGESTANCSFHLRLLGKYGFLEPGVGRTRRDRPWRAVPAHPLAALWEQLDGFDTVSAGRSELMRRQLRLFDVDDLEAAA
ncbi:MAG TPA: helix-turn-helix domain-containing protein [Gaiellaceae bacterium]|nr:helix-turn-helix domain-containing protein [Gaiellaceae bacterium]